VIEALVAGVAAIRNTVLGWRDLCRTRFEFFGGDTVRNYYGAKSSIHVSVQYQFS